MDMPPITGDQEYSEFDMTEEAGQKEHSPGAGKPQVDLHALAEELIRMLKQDLRHEKERRGGL